MNSVLVISENAHLNSEGEVSLIGFTSCPYIIYVLETAASLHVERLLNLKTT